jgi:uncharacterized coiled-coil protein SlyX
MTVSAQLNKLTKKDLDDICSQNNVEVPKSIKTKKDLVTFMESYDKWPTPLEEILGGSTPKPVAKPVAKTAPSAPATAPGVDLKVIEEIQKQINDLSAKMATPSAPAAAPGVDPKIIGEMQKQIKDLNGKLTTISEVLAKVTEDMKLFQASLNAVNNSNADSEASVKRLREIDMQVAEAIVEGEWTPLDDVKELLEDISEEEFLESLRYLLAVGAVQGEEEGSELQVELMDGTTIGKVKK